MPRQWKRRGQVVAAIAAGGVVGAEARYALTLLNGEPDSFPWVTLAENVSGCLLIGVLMAVLLELTAAHRLLRPFLGVGVLGGYTTFSAYAVEVRALVEDDRGVAALTYLLVTPVAALVAVWLGMRATQAGMAGLRRRREGASG